MLKLLTIYFHLEDFDHYGVRNIILNPDKGISIENIKFYYKNFIGLDNDYLFMFEHDIPQTFDINLLGKCGNPTKLYPVYDLLIEKDKIDPYKTYVSNVIATEISRNSLITHVNENVIEKPTWLEDIEKFYNSNKNNKDIEYIGIVCSPVHVFTKESKGFKFLNKKEDIDKWDKLLGTYEFPDFMVVRKYNIMNWSYVSKSSEKMLNSILIWFACAYGCSSQYSFIPCDIEQLDKLINAFKSIGYTLTGKKDIEVIEHVFDDFEFDEKIKPEIYPTYEPLKIACAQIEEVMLKNSSIVDKSSLVLFENKTIFNNYIYQLLIDLNTSFTSENEYLVENCERWFRDKWGVQIEKLTLSYNSDPIFKMIVDHHNYCEKSIEVWLMYREVHTNGESLTHKRKLEILREFVKISIKKCKKTGDERRIRSKFVYEYLKKELFQFLPRKYFEKTIIPNNLFSMVCDCGIRSILTETTRNFIGILLPNDKEPERTALDEFLELVD